MGAQIKQVMDWLGQLSSLQAGLAGAGLVLFLVMLWAWFKKPELAGIIKLSEGRGLASGICAWIGKKLRALWQGLDYLATRREWRYEQPWMLMLGEQGSGKTSLLRSVSMSVRQVPPKRASELHAKGTEWYFFRKGVLIDPDGMHPAAAADSSEARHWYETLDALKSLRPERPLDGLVLCISAHTLLSAPQEAREALATNLYSQLAELQERIEFMLPLTVVVTQCDNIKGFDAFWRSQSAARRVELFGYSAASQAQTCTPSDWADSAFETIGDALRALQVETAASKDSIKDADGFFLFPSHFQQLHAPLRCLLELVFRASAWQAGYLFRGLFFTGSPEAGGEMREGAREDIAFADALIASRVLAEPGLARPTRNGLFSRNKLIRAMQYGAITAVLGMFVALYFASLRVSVQVQALVSAQTQLDRATPDAVRKGECLEEESIYPLLKEVARIDHNTSYWAIPASWLDGRVATRSDSDIEGGAIGRVVMPTLACQLENRARELAASPLGLPSEDDELAFSKARSVLASKLAGTLALEENIARFERLATRSGEMTRTELIGTLAALAQYLFEAPVPQEVLNERGALSDGFVGLKRRENLDLPPHMRPDLGAQIRRIAAQTRGDLHTEIKRGAILLARLDRAEAPVLGNTRRFSEWLSWAEKSWLMSTPSTNPCEEIRLSTRTALETLVNSYGYDAGLLRELVRFDAERCYVPELKVLAELRQAPYGALFEPRKPDGLQIAQGLRKDLSGMPALVQMSFMLMPSTQRFRCQPGSEGFRQAELTEAAGYLREYDAFVDKMKLGSIPAGSRPLYDRLARLSLGNALDDAMQRAQIAPSKSPYQQVSLEVVMQADQQLSAMSTELTGGLGNLVTVLRRHGDFGDAAVTPVLRQCARNFASDSLSRISALADSSRLYNPQPTSLGDHMFDLGGLPVQKEFLARQVARAQVLANYATPFMNLLSGSQGVVDTQRQPDATAEFWRNSIDELNRYTQGKEPVGQVGNLDNYFIKQLGELSYPGCAKQLAGYQSPAFGNDLFSMRRRPLETMVAQRCSNREVAQAMEVYGDVARRFNRELAGRYPFADASAQDARSAVVRQFFLDYAQQRPALEEALLTLSGERWRAARQFVAELNALAEFFRSNLTAGDSDRGMPIRLNLAFNTRYKPTSGSEQIVAWLLSSGTHAAGIPNRASTLDWQVGESLALDLSWASGSTWVPVADAQQEDLIAEGNTATFFTSQPWALLRLIGQHAVSDAANTRGQLLLGFTVPQQRELSPGKAERSHVNLYLGMTLLGLDPKTQAETKLSLPAKFPQRAPVPTDN